MECDYALYTPPAQRAAQMNATDRAWCVTHRASFAGVGA